MFALLKTKKIRYEKKKVEKNFIKNSFATKITFQTQKISKNHKFTMIILKRMSITKKKRYYCEKN